MSNDLINVSITDTMKRARELNDIRTDMTDHDKEIYNKAIEDYQVALLKNNANTAIVRRLAEQLRKT